MKEEKKFHGEYFSPGQGKRADQYTSSLKIITWVIVIGIITIICLIVNNIFFN
jgi:hypothetical protein